MPTSEQPAPTLLDLFRKQLRDLPYFRALIRAAESSFYQELEMPRPVLDIGCGDGHFAATTFSSPLDVGIDPWGKAIKEAARRNGYYWVVQSDGQRLPFADGSFASAVSNSVLEHIRPVDLVLSEIHRVLKPGSPFFMCVPNPAYLEQLSIAGFLNKIGLNQASRFYTEWFRKMSRVEHADPPTAWKERLQAAGFRLERWWHYLPPPAWHAAEWGHYFGAPTLLPHALFGRWILAPANWNLALTERFLQPYLQQVIDPEGVFTFYVARKPDFSHSSSI